MRDHDPQKLVARIPLFASLEPEARKPVAGLIRVRRYAARQPVVWEGEAGGSVVPVADRLLQGDHDWP